MGAVILEIVAVGVVSGLGRDLLVGHDPMAVRAVDESAGGRASLLANSLAKRIDQIVRGHAVFGRRAHAVERIVGITIGTVGARFADPVTDHVVSECPTYATAGNIHQAIAGTGHSKRPGNPIDGVRGPIAIGIEPKTIADAVALASAGYAGQGVVVVALGHRRICAVRQRRQLVVRVVAETQVLRGRAAIDGGQPTVQIVT